MRDISPLFDYIILRYALCFHWLTLECPCLSAALLLLKDVESTTCHYAEHFQVFDHGTICIFKKNLKTHRKASFSVNCCAILLRFLQHVA